MQISYVKTIGNGASVDAWNVTQNLTQFNPILSQLQLRLEIFD